MMQTSFVLKNTIRPTFNHTFYFPVRFFNEKITSRKYLETAFLYEMRSKGDIQIQAEHPVGSVGVDDVSMMVIYGDVSMMILW
jgi:Ca2+-dependent lipid-binding protein